MSAPASVREKGGFLHPCPSREVGNTLRRDRLLALLLGREVRFENMLVLPTRGPSLFAGVQLCLRAQLWQVCWSNSGAGPTQRLT
jgi:hypothetical protein